MQQLQKYEAGVSRIPVSRLHEIAQVLAVPVTWFFLQETARTGTSAEAPRDSCLEKEIDRLVSLFRAIQDPRFRQAIIELAAILAEMSRPQP